jgi:hypothetical protein
MIDSSLTRSVTDAAVELCCGDSLLKPRLLSAVRALNTALVQRENWPPMLRQRAQDVADELNACGAPEQAIAAMDAHAARRLAERILHLYADCRIATVER